MFLSIIFWACVVIAVILGGFGALLFISGASGKADPTDHGNIVALQYGVVFIIFSAIPGAIALLIKVFT